MEKQSIQVATENVERDDLFGEINEVISFLTKIRNKYKNGEHIEVVEDWCGYEDNYFEISVTRLETDEECLKREAEDEKALIKAREAQDRLTAKIKKKEAILKQIEELKKQL